MGRMGETGTPHRDMGRDRRTRHGDKGVESGDMRMFGLGKWQCQSSREGDLKGWGGNMGLVKLERTRSRAWGHVVLEMGGWGQRTWG